MYILGINSAYHETAACLLKDGLILAAAEEERFTRKKHGKTSTVHNPHELPIKAMNYCLSSAGIGLEDVDYIGFSLNPQKRLKNQEFKDIVEEGNWGSAGGEEEFYGNICRVPINFQHMGFKGEFVWIDHHLCHAASAYYLSPFSEAAVLTVDGIGETGSTLLAYGKGEKITILQEIQYPSSIGFLWEKISKFLGFTEYDAYKVMGLAAYGCPDRYITHFRQIAPPLPLGNFAIDNSILRFRVEDYTGLERLFGLKRNDYKQTPAEPYKDIAAALQKRTNELVLALAKRLYEQTQAENLCLAGGVALNCITNEFIHTQGDFSNLYIQPASHDAGTAIGAALEIWCGQLAEKRRYVMHHAYLGPSFSNDEIEQQLKEANLPYECVDNIERTVAELLSKGNIVGWFQGAMEFGPRALGNRSLLADPRNHNIREILNLKIKHREEFRPLAPSVLEEAALDGFEIHKLTSASDFMLMAYPVKDSFKGKIPAVVHIDGTSRVQTVRQNINPRYHKLIWEFFQITGIPLVLNTSFNDSEPIVCTPRDAIATFLKTQMDYLAIGDFLLDGNRSRARVTHNSAIGQSNTCCTLPHPVAGWQVPEDSS